ncbi:MAG: hypothetical protein JTT11_02700, partial [Candidatus Brockarchaeota archaeon]|nr:hypothetical protein [Candidatus Brockarchaeota archaeon]
MISASIEIEGRSYALEFDPWDRYASPGLAVAYSQQLAEDFMPVILDPGGHGSRPCPPEFAAYRLVVDRAKRKLCALYEIYWRRQECTWRELNKDHDHDYEQVQIHFDLATGRKERVVVSSIGSVEHGGHGVEVYSEVGEAKARNVEYETSPKGPFPWGGPKGQRGSAEIREVPISKLAFENGRPVVVILNCYHAFAGLKRKHVPGEWARLVPAIERLDQKLLEEWYYRNSKNRFGHDISKPFDEPHVMYYLPPEEWKSRAVSDLI